MFGAIFIFSCVSDRPGKGLILTERSFDICCVFVAFLATGKVDFSWPAIYDFHVVSHCPVSFFKRKLWPIVVPAALKDLIDLAVLPDNSVPVPLLVEEVVKTEKARSSKARQEDGMTKDSASFCLMELLREKIFFATFPLSPMVTACLRVILLNLKNLGMTTSRSIAPRM